MSKSTKRKCPACGQTKLFRSDNKSCGCRGTNPNLSAPVAAPKSVPVAPPALTTADIAKLELQKLRDKRAGKEEHIAYLENEVLRLERENEAFLQLSGTPQTIDVRPKVSSGVSESAAVVVWSDHHSEELVRAEAVGNKNEHNLEINQRRFDNLVHGTLSWFNIAKQKTTIKNITLALLGDFITGSIHEDLAESNLLPPVEAIYRVQGQLIGGITYLLKNTPPDVDFIIICHGGNHGRMTKDQRISTEGGNSLERYMYFSVRDHFQNEKRCKFIVANGYHSYVNYFEGAYDVRYHHGHQMNYQGGVGGLTIPVNKSIAQWNKARAVNLDVFGHFHTKFDGGNFIANGSLIGYNPYAVSIKASYEKPSQTFFLINREYAEKTMVSPIFV